MPFISKKRKLKYTYRVLRNNYDFKRIFKIFRILPRENSAAIGRSKNSTLRSLASMIG